MCHICTVFTKKTFFFTISGQKCCKGREGSSFRGLFEIFLWIKEWRQSYINYRSVCFEIRKLTSTICDPNYLLIDTTNYCKYEIKWACPLLYMLTLHDLADQRNLFWSIDKIRRNKKSGDRAAKKSMALLMKIFGFTSILFILPRIPTTIGYSEYHCWLLWYIISIIIIAV